MKTLLVYLLLLCNIIIFEAHAKPVWDDSEKGATRDFYNKSAGMKWDKSLGDWIDADDKAWGGISFSSRIINQSIQGEYVEFDVTTLVNKWLSGGENQGFFLQGRGDVVKISSREDFEFSPRLELVTHTGRQSLKSAYDTSLVNSSGGSQGARAHIQLSKGSNGLIWFDLNRFRKKEPLARATLKLYIKRVYKNGGLLSVFEAKPGIISSAISPLELGLAAKFVNDLGIEEHRSVYLYESFDSRNILYDILNKSWLTEGKKAGSITRPEQHRAYKPLLKESLTVEIEKGGRSGINQRFKFNEKGFGEPEAAYFRYYFRLGDNWNPITGGKLPGFAGTYNTAGWGGRKSDGSNGWSTRGAFKELLSDGSDRTPVGNYVYHANMPGTYGNNWMWNKSGGALLEKNRWYCIEQFVRLNDPEMNNGVLAAWLDGREVFRREDIKYRNTSKLKIEEVWFNVYHGGRARAEHTQHVFIDNIVIAREYIGPLGGNKNRSDRVN